MSIKIEGFEVIEKSLEELGDSNALIPAMEKACLIVETKARQKAQTDTGELRRSIASKVDINGDDIQGIVYTPLEYAPYVEYGTGLFAEDGNGRKNVPWYYEDDEGDWHITSGMKPHPYLRPALNESREDIKKILGEALKDD